MSVLVLLEKLQQVSTTCISDAMDYFNLNGCISGIRPLSATMRTVGIAFTIKYVEDDQNSLAPTANYADLVDEHSVIVVDNSARNHCTVWGGMLTLSAMNSGARGAIIHGCCRDADEIVDFNFPTFSAGVFMRTGKGRVKVEKIQAPVVIDGIVVNPGDLICADLHGVVVVPKEYIEKVSNLAIAISENDEKIMKLLKKGVSLAKAKQQYSYDTFAKQLMSESKCKF